ncbi:hypothetical protein P168DRAFT_95319 [Aspergillus campestris IBT 28561]|uniref:Uncharacterized protein n=1 Tax=Aspergillus campestris (strain IBT 28561) TaxID=1392248 RepID=A0A2I1DC02_ASPC2|nr:uncharacterized protein P168DRAFT_95319 [Aspergillus campestris IBT 28561]PKY07391.1 hypothetical protein P168DRAFT_95319 [Aspergillus campestris IBT 28561]
MTFATDGTRGLSSVVWGIDGSLSTTGASPTPRLPPKSIHTMFRVHLFGPGLCWKGQTLAKGQGTGDHRGGRKKVLLRPDGQRFSSDDNNDDHNGCHPHQVPKQIIYNVYAFCRILSSASAVGFHDHSVDLLRLRSMVFFRGLDPGETSPGVERQRHFADGWVLLSAQWEPSSMV